MADEYDDKLPREVADDILNGPDAWQLPARTHLDATVALTRHAPLPEPDEYDPDSE